MPYCHFSKVYRGMKWVDVEKVKNLQIQRKCKELEYCILACYAVSDEVFNQFCEDISIPRHIYQDVADQSIASPEGKWKCIVIENAQCTKRIILYTAGRLYPLYVAIEN